MSGNNIHISYPGWDIIKKIGSGSYGTVYEIERDLYGKKEKAALKLISIPRDDSDIEELQSSGYSDESITAHFKSYLADIVREYSLMAELKGHTNIVCCDDIRQIQKDDGFGWEIYIRMELLTPLLKAIDQEMPEEQIIKLGVDLCTALSICRKRNILHRDIKPQNIFVSQDGDYKLGDFGIAKVSEHTSGGTKIGTYNYMAPEVYNNAPYGHASDIYSLGLVLYWLLNYRRHPFNPLPPQMPSASEMESARSRRLGGEELPPPACGSEKLKQVVLKACAFDPKDRYQSAEDMREALENVMLQITGDETTIDEKNENLTDVAETMAHGHDISENSSEQMKKLYREVGRDEKKSVAEEESNRELKKKKSKKPGKKQLALVGIVVAVIAIIAAVSVLSLPSELDIAGSKVNRNAGILRLENVSVSESDIKQIEKLKNVTAVYFKECNFKGSYESLEKALEKVFSNVTTVEFVNCSGSIRLPQTAPNLKYLTISGTYFPSLVGRIQNYPQLVTLNISHNSLTTLPNLTTHTNLKSLDCSNNELSGDVWKYLPQSTVFKTLIADSNGLTSDDLAEISKQTGLTTLSLNNNNITNINALVGLTALQHLSLNNNQVEDLSALNSMIYLTELRLGGNGISDISPLSNCTRLEIVQLNDNNLTDIRTLEKSVGYIKKLYISGNNISDVDFLSGAERLEFLDADNNLIFDLSCIAGLENLKGLSAADNFISELVMPSAASNLEYIDVHGNDLINLAIEYCTQLQYINISNTHLESLHLPAFTYAYSYIYPTLIASNTPLQKIYFDENGKNEFSFLLLDSDPDLFSSIDSSLSSIGGDTLVFSYDSDWGKIDQMQNWHFKSYCVISPSLDAIRDIEDALGANKVTIAQDANEIYGKAWQDYGDDLNSEQSAPAEVTEITRAPKPEPRPEPQPEPQPEITDQKVESSPASRADLDAIGASIIYPSERHYLAEKETMYIRNAEHPGRAVYCYNRPIAQETYRIGSIADGTEVTVLARRNGLSCVIYQDGTRIKAAWVTSTRLAYE